MEFYHLLRNTGCTLLWDCVRGISPYSSPAPFPPLFCPSPPFPPLPLPCPAPPSCPQQSFAHWYRLLEKKAKEVCCMRQTNRPCLPLVHAPPLPLPLPFLQESPSRLVAYLGLVRSVAAFIKTSREALQPIFAE